MPGAGKQPVHIQEQIKELLEAGFDPTTIHRRLKVGRSSIYRMKRCLQEHGTAYMPLEMNKKNGRPKVLSAEQELEVRDWLRKPENRGRYLDDLVWLIHDRFGIVCSTTTMSKMKRKWLRVIEFEETGRALDSVTRFSLLETHPNLQVLHDDAVAHPNGDPEAFMQQHGLHQQPHPYPQQPVPQAMMQAPPTPTSMTASMLHQANYHHHHHHQHSEPQIDSQLLEQQIQQDIASSEA